LRNLHISLVAHIKALLVLAITVAVATQVVAVDSPYI